MIRSSTSAHFEQHHFELQTPHGYWEPWALESMEAEAHGLSAPWRHGPWGRLTQNAHIALCILPEHFPRPSVGAWVHGLRGPWLHGIKIAYGRRKAWRSNR